MSYNHLCSANTFYFISQPALDIKNSLGIVTFRGRLLARISAGESEARMASLFSTQIKLVPYDHPCSANTLYFISQPALNIKKSLGIVTFHGRLLTRISEKSEATMECILSTQIKLVPYDHPCSDNTLHIIFQAVLEIEKSLRNVITRSRLLARISKESEAVMVCLLSRQIKLVSYNYPSSANIFQFISQSALNIDLSSGIVTFHGRFLARISEESEAEI